jgi:hypothetical protein
MYAEKIDDELISVHQVDWVKQFSSACMMCSKKCCKKYKEGKRCKKCPKK